MAAEIWVWFDLARIDRSVNVSSGRHSTKIWLVVPGHPFSVTRLLNWHCPLKKMNPWSTLEFLNGELIHLWYLPSCGSSTPWTLRCQHLCDNHSCIELPIYKVKGWLYQNCSYTCDFGWERIPYQLGRPQPLVVLQSLGVWKIWEPRLGWCVC